MSNKCILNPRLILIENIIYHYRHIFVYSWDKMERQEENILQP